MHPILYQWAMTRSQATVGGIIVAILLAAFVVWDGLREHGREKLWSLIAQAVLLFVVLALVAIRVPTTMPEPVRIPITGWGLFAVIGMTGGWLIQRYLAKKRGIDPDHVYNLWLYGGSTGLVGCRLLHVILNPEPYLARPWTALAFWDGGLVFLGAALGYIIYCVYYFSKHKLPIELLDVLAIGFAFGHGASRIGCFLGGCCWGQPTDMFWAVEFPPESIVYQVMLQTGEVAQGSLHTAALHPTQLYEATLEISLGVYLLYRVQSAFRPGAVAATYFVIYPIGRFTIELFRADPDRQFLFRIPQDAPVFLSTSQTLSIALFSGALAVWFLWVRRKQTVAGFKGAG